MQENSETAGPAQGWSAGCAVHIGDCRKVLAGMEPDSFDSCVTDPPYHLTAGKKGGTGDASVNPNSPAGRSMISTGFMGKAWDGGDVAFQPETWAAVWRVLKPGAHLVAFGGTRTQHRMACAIEDAGFEIRDSLMWVYGSGFPKSLDVSKALDKMAGAEREVVATVRVKGGGTEHINRTNARSHKYRPGEYQKGENVLDVTAPATEAARQWQGWGTSLKPSYEPIILARKPLSEPTVAANVLRHGTSAVNVDACRVGTDEDLNGGTYSSRTTTSGVSGSMAGPLKNAIGAKFEQPAGRWPPNLLHDGSPEVLAAFARFGERSSRPGVGTSSKTVVYGRGWRETSPADYVAKDDTGTAARFFPALGYGEDDLPFFYCAKAGKADRAGSKHPTVKPQALMRWLCRLVTPPGGHVLDPFAGSGSTLAAALREGFQATGIEEWPEYHADILRRLAMMRGEDGGLFAEPAPKPEQETLL